MCTYCNPDKSIDISDRSIFEENIDCGILGDLTLSLLISPAKKSLELAAYTNEKPSNTPMTRKNKYCPFCGRPL